MGEMDAPWAMRTEWAGPARWGSRAEGSQLWGRVGGPGRSGLLSVALLVGFLAGIWSRPALAGLWQRDSLALQARDDGNMVIRLYRALERARRKAEPGRSAALQIVLKKIRAALAANQDKAVVWYLLGLTLENLQSKEALAALLEARRRGATGALAEGISFHLALLYVRRHRCDKALEEYRRTRALLSSDSDRAVVAANEAECQMTLGRLSQALDGYRRALRLAPGSLGGRWGLAVALDRQGRTREALAMARAARAGDPKLTALVGPGVFFVPAVEVEYYLAMAALASGDERDAALHWRKYLDGFPDSLWRIPAGRHLVRLGVRPRGHRVVLQPVAARQGALRISSVMRRIVSKAVMRCMVRRRSDPMMELRMRLDFVVGRDGRVRSVALWPPGPWRSCLADALVGRAFSSAGSVARQVRLMVLFLLDWGTRPGSSPATSLERRRPGHSGGAGGSRD